MSPPLSRAPDDRQITQRAKPVTADWLFRAAVHYLGRYASSTDNLRRVLDRKIERRLRAADGDDDRAADEDPDRHRAMIDATLARLTNLKLLDDGAYAEARFAALRRRGISLRQAQAKLAQKGLPREAVDAVLTSDSVGDAASARAYAKRRRLGPYRPAERADRRERDLAAMMRAGFSYGDAKAAIDAAPEAGAGV